MLPNILSVTRSKVATTLTLNAFLKYFSNTSVDPSHIISVAPQFGKARILATTSKQCIRQRLSFSTTNCQAAASKEGNNNVDKGEESDSNMACCGKKQIFGYNSDRIGCGCDTSPNDGLKCGVPTGKTHQLQPKVTPGPIMKRIISTPLAPRPVAPYSQAVVADRTVYVSGCLGLNKETNKLVPGGIVEETRQAMNSLGIILHEAGSCFNNIVKTTVLLSDIKDFPVFNEVYREFFEDERCFPARVAYQVAALPLGAKVEIDAVAITEDAATVEDNKSI